MELKSIIIKNFLSIGNIPVTIDFKTGINIIVGNNGQGKSTILDALSFVLFGKSYSDKNKAQLINRKNKKNVIVSLEFNTNNINYTILRGIKPDLQRIIENGVERNITDIKSFNYEICTLLNIDMKVFSHTTFMSNDFYEPFLTLPVSKKRDFLKRIFSFEKFEDMEKNIKNDLTTFENECTTNTSKLSTLNDRQELMYKHLEDKKTFITTEILSLNQQIESIQKQIEHCSSMIVDLPDFDTKEFNQVKREINDVGMLLSQVELYKENTLRRKELSNKLSKIDYNEKTINSFPELKIIYDNSIREFLRNIKDSKEQIKYIENNDICSHCGNIMSDEYKQSNINKLNLVIKQNEKDLKEAELKFKQDKILYEYEKKKHDEYQVIKKQLDSIPVLMISVNEQDERNKLNILEERERELQKLNDNIQKMFNENQKYILQNQMLEKNKINLIKKVHEYEIKITELDYTQVDDIKKQIDHIKESNIKTHKKIDIMKMLLKSVGDQGIKKFVIKNYIPLLNNIINEFSTLIDNRFMVKFTQDGMDIEITDRGIVVDYGQLSSGEKQRLSLIILFTFIRFIRLKSGNNFPLVFFDEILNSSLDSSGLEGLTKILNIMRPQIPYIFIITHNNDNKELADNIISVKKENGFSVYK